MLNFIVCHNVSMSVVHETFQSNSNELSDGRKRSWLCVHLHASLSTTLN